VAAAIFTFHLNSLVEKRRNSFGVRQGAGSEKKRGWKRGSSVSFCGADQPLDSRQWSLLKAHCARAGGNNRFARAQRFNFVP